MRNRNRHIKTMWIKSRLSFVACGATRDVALHITSYPWPKEVSGQHVLRLFNTKMSHQTTAMGFLQQPKTNGASWNTQLVSMVEKAFTQQEFLPQSSLSTIFKSIFEVHSI
jgi:hypothetical protein